MCTYIYMLEVTKIYIHIQDLKLATLNQTQTLLLNYQKATNIGEDTLCSINDIVLPVSWTTIDERNNKL